MRTAFSAALVALAAAALLGAGVGLAEEPAAADSTRRMAERIAAIFRAQDFRTDPYKNGERAEYLRRMLTEERNPETRLRIERARGEALLLKGDSAGAVVVLEEARRTARKAGLSTTFERDLRDLLTTTYLRLGEQQNCLLHHGSESCLFPIRGTGIHGIKDGSRRAVAELLATLQDDPSDWNARWLLTIASMTLGEPTPKPWEIPTRLFDSEFDIGRFPDVAPELGLNVIGHSGGVVADDFDGDGHFDVVLSSSAPLDPIRFFHNEGNGRFVERTAEAGLTGVTSGLNIVQTDYDNDGHLDLFILRGGWLGTHGKYPNSLLRNRGDGTFEDVTEAAGLLSFHPTQVGSWADYDGDGWLDLFVGNESSDQEAHPSELFHNNRDGTFTNLAAQVGLADLGFVKGATWGDYDDDGRPDLYVSIKGERNRLFHNDGAQPDGRWGFSDVTRRAGVGQPDHSFATWFWDYDNDGRLDLLVTGYYTERNADIGAFFLGMPNRAEVPRLYRNRGDGRFEEVAHRLGLDRVILPMGANFGDLDNDGWLDCYFGTGIPDYQGLLPNRMFRNDQGRRFQDVTTAGGFGHLQKGHGVAFADLDGDGDQDVVEELGGAYEGDVYTSAVFQNPGHGNHWIRLKLEGVRSNRAAIGARIRVRALTDAGPRDIHRVVVSGASFGSSPLEQHVGLGSARAVQEVEVRWPASGLVQTLRGLELDRRYRVREGEDRALPLPPRAGLDPAAAFPPPEKIAEVRKYIRQAWTTLSRTASDLPAAAPDPKLKAHRGAWPVYVSPREDRAQVAAQLEKQLDAAGRAQIELRVLPTDARAVTEHGLLYLPRPYVVPGGRFNEMYGWDSYFILVGLLRDGEVGRAQEMTENFLYEVEHYGMVLNANRTYYLSRSQPPFLTRMILGVFEKTHDRAWLRASLPAAEKYYRFWTSPPHLLPELGLSRYYDLGEGPAPEVLSDERDERGRTHYDRAREYYRTHEVTDYDVALFYDAKADRLSDLFYKGDRSMRESGFDPSERFGPFSADIVHYAPVCLNALLYQMELDLAEIQAELGDQEAAKGWRRRAEERRQKIDRYLWDPQAGLYLDYNFQTGQRRHYEFATTFYPLWAGIASAQQAARVVEALPRFEAPGGLLTSTRTTGNQWDAPFGWAPLQLLAVQGLRRYGYDDDADRLARKFVALVVKEFEEHGGIVEKYDVRRRESDVSADIRFGYASNEVGFGWTNAVVVELLAGLDEAERRKAAGR